jgi:hypothetical protein
MSISAVGDPQPSASWVQNFGITASATFTSFGVALTNFDATPYFGLINSGPPAIDFSQGGTAGWFQSFFGPFPSGPGFVATAMGVPATELVWQSHFGDPLSHPFVMTVFAYDNITSTNVFDSATATWNGSNWLYNADDGMSWIDFQEAVAGGAAPLPSAALLGVVGLSGVALARRRMSAS